MEKIKRFFSLNPADRTFELLDSEQKVLVKSGISCVKQYFAERNKSDSVLFSMLNDPEISDRKKLNDLTVEKIAKYSAKRAGMNVENFTAIDVLNPQVNGNFIFQQTFAAVLAQVMTPVLPDMVSSGFMGMADVANINWGDTGRFKTNSNDTFYVTNLAEGILRGSIT